MLEQLYTPERANKTLGEVKEIVTRIVELKKASSIIGYKESNDSIAELGSLFSKLEERGIELKDINTGLIDFPATRFGERVYLCWKLGEAEVMFWHDLRGGFKGRRPLKPDALQIQ